MNFLLNRPSRTKSKNLNLNQNQNNASNKTKIMQFELDDQRGKSACQLCNKSFSMTKREHQCKRCKRATCHECAT